MMIITYMFLGLLAGIFGGLLGIGGGVVMIPSLVLLFGLSQHRAQGTVLAAMLPPVSLLAVIEYYRVGNIDVRMAVWMAVGLLVGGLIGAIFAGHISEQLLCRIFGGFLMIIAVKMLMMGR